MAYLVLFAGGLIFSGYFLSCTVALNPIPLTGLLKYLLLCVLFFILLINAMGALTLKPQRLDRLAASARNFKWLFAIAVLLCVAAWLGLFNGDHTQPIVVTPLQVAILIILALFCFWSDSVLNTRETGPEENIGA